MWYPFLKNIQWYPFLLSWFQVGEGTYIVLSILPVTILYLWNIDFVKLIDYQFVTLHATNWSIDLNWVFNCFTNNVVIGLDPFATNICLHGLIIICSLLQHRIFYEQTTFREDFRNMTISYLGMINSTLKSPLIIIHIVTYIYYDIHFDL